MKKCNEPMKYFAAIGLLGLIILVPVWAQSHSDKKQETPSDSDPSALQALIKKMENDRIQAGVRKDVDAIAAVTADDYVNIDFDGQVRNKMETLERIRSSEIQLQSNTLDEIEVRIYGNVAVVTGRATPKGTVKGKDFGTPIRYSRVYVKKDRAWQVVLFQQTRVSKEQ
jgi:ketosteroid isomerase-like protein